MKKFLFTLILTLSVVFTTYGKTTDSITEDEMKKFSTKVFGNDNILQILEGYTPSDKPELYGKAFYLPSSYKVELGETTADGTYIAIYKK